MNEIKKRLRSVQTMQWLLILVGAVGIADTIFAKSFSNWNLGVVMPAVMGAPLLLTGLFYERLLAFPLWPWFKGGLIGAYGAFLLLFLFCLALMLNAPKAELETPFDAVIVLGAAVQGETMSATLERRTEAAAQYLERHSKAVCVVSGGQGKEERITEASAMRAYLLKRGIAGERILSEERAESTRENFLFSKALLDEHFEGKPYRAVFVTSAFHIYRAEQEAIRAGLRAKGIPVSSYWYAAPNFYLRETAAIVKGWFAQ